MGRAEIHGAEYAIEKVFSNDFAFQVPYYQRPYAWTTEHASELLDDLTTAVGKSSDAPDSLDPYFLGSVVLIKDRGPESNIVDGQQRITTLTILLAVIRDILKPVNKKFADGLTQFLLEEGNLVTGTPTRYRLTLRERDYDFFRGFILEDGGPAHLKTLTKVLPDAQQRIRENALYFLEQLGSRSPQQLERLAQFIVKRCFLVVVSTPDLDSAYRIFSILNDRGLDLSHADILKAEIIGQIEEARQEKYTKMWEDAEEQLGREEFQNLFTHIRMIYRKTKLRETILKEFREHIQPSKNPTKFIDETLLPMAATFDDIVHATYQSTARAGEINEVLQWLQRVDNVDWIPPAILYITKHKDEPDRILGFLLDLDRLAYGLMILRSNVNERVDRYGKVLTSIERGDDLAGSQSDLQLSHSEASEIIQTLNGDLYENTRICMPVLLRLDAALSSGGASYSYPILSVEHVLPQNPPVGSQWVTWFPKEDERPKVVHKLGNLALLSRRKNSQAQNFDFDRKKREYFSKNGVSPFALTTQVLNENVWTLDVIRNRQQLLVDKLKGLWRL